MEWRIEEIDEKLKGIQLKLNKFWMVLFDIERAIDEEEEEEEERSDERRVSVMCVESYWTDGISDDKQNFDLHLNEQMNH